MSSVENEPLDEIKTTLGNVRDSLFGSGHNLELYEESLRSLGRVAATTSASSQIREKVVRDHEVKNICFYVISNSLCNIGEVPENLISLYIRLIRGVVIVVRNLSSSALEFDISAVVESAERLIKIAIDWDLKKQAVVSYIECLANLSHHLPSDDFIMVYNSLLKEDTIYSFIENDPHLKRAMVTMLNNTLLGSNLRVLLLGENPVMNFILKELKIFEAQQTLDFSSSLVANIYMRIISNEYYCSWIKERIQEPTEIVPLLRANRLLITSKENWGQYEIIGIMAWLYELFLHFCRIAKEEISYDKFNYQKLELLNEIMVMLLDSVSELVKIETVREYLDYYNAMDSLIDLLGTLHKNVERETLKNMERNSGKPKKKFPFVKSLIIEILTFMVHKSFANQEKMRKLHGLELVLSSCTIDRNEPFIKEKAIFCLRFVLEKNEENQKLVASLEAKGAQDESVNALREAGYELAIQDGKVGLKKTRET